MPKRTSDRLSERVSDPDRVGHFDERVVVTQFMHPDPARAFAHDIDSIQWPAPVPHRLRLALVLSPRAAPTDAALACLSQLRERVSSLFIAAGNIAAVKAPLRLIYELTPTITDSRVDALWANVRLLHAPFHHRP